MVSGQYFLTLSTLEDCFGFQSSKTDNAEPGVHLDTKAPDCNNWVPCVPGVSDETVKRRSILTAKLWC